MNPFENLADAGLSYGDQSAYPALGFNPAPGTTGTITTLAQNFLTVSGNLEQAYQAMMSAGQAGGFWEGDAASEFHQDIGKLPDYLDKATRSLGDAGRALDGWANDLSALQSTAADYERQAEDAVRQLNQAKSNPDLGLANEEFSDQQALQEAQQRLDAATSEVDSAQSSLNAIRDQAKRLWHQHQDLVSQVEDALNKAKNEAPHKPGMFSSIGSALSGMMHHIGDLASKTWKFVKQHANVIAKVGDVLSAVGTVLSVAAAATAEIPVVGEVVEGVSLGVNAEALAAHSLAKAAGAKVSDATLAADALSMVPGGAMLKSTKVVQVAKAFRAADEGGRMAAGGRAMEEASAGQLGKWAHQAQVLVSKVPKLSERIGVTAVETGKKTVYTASNAAGRVAGAVVGTGWKVGVQVGKWEAPTLINDGKDLWNMASDAQLQPAGQVFTNVLQSRNAI